MIDKLIRFSIRHRWLVMLGGARGRGLGIYNYQRLPIDAVPDITNVQVQINTEAPGYSPLEAEQRITFPSKPRWPAFRSWNTRARSRATACRRSRSSSRTARTSTWRGSRSPSGSSRPKSQLPPASKRRWVRSPPASARFTCGRSTRSPAQRNRMARLTRRPICARCRIGSSSRSSATCPAWSRSTRSADSRSSITSRRIPAKLVAYGLSFRDVMEALAKNNANVGAGYIERNGEQYLIRAPGQVSDIEDIAQHRRRHARRRARSASAMWRRWRSARNCAPARPRTTASEVVLGTTFMLMGENSRTVSQRVAERMKEVNRSAAGGRGREHGLQPHRLWSTRPSRR